MGYTPLFGGFSPMTADGYGVCYAMLDGRMVYLRANPNPNPNPNANPNPNPDPNPDTNPSTNPNPNTNTNPLNRRLTDEERNMLSPPSFTDSHPNPNTNTNTKP